MNLNELIPEERIASSVTSGSKKRVLESLSHLIVTSEGSLAETEVFESFLHRERLGSTAMGPGVAIPHGRMKSLDHAVGALIRLHGGVDYDALDGEPVDLVFGLLVPEDAGEEYLQILSSLAQTLRDTEVCKRIRAARDSKEIYQILLNEFAN